ncbi:MAG: hypothetical protein ABID45_02930 [Patescibacteria group bacterium]
MGRLPNFLHGQNKVNLFYYLNQILFKSFLIIYLIILVLENLYKGIISDFFNLHWLILIILITGFNEIIKSLKPKLKKRGSNLKILNYFFIITTTIILIISIYHFLPINNSTAFNQNFDQEYKNISTILKWPDLPFTEDINQKEGYQIMHDNIGYFNVKVPNGTTKIDLELEIENPTDLIDLSVPISSSQYYSKNIYNTTINDLYKLNKNFIYDEDSKLILFQKGKNYYSVQNFLDHALNESAFFSTNNLNYFQFNNYQSTSDVQNINLPLRGPHLIYTYIGEGEKLNWNFEYEELNRDIIDDSFLVRLYSTDKLITEIENQDQLLLDDLDPGFYLIELRNNFDILTTNISTTQKYFALKNRADLFNNKKESNLKIIGEELKYKTIHNTGLQSISFNGTKDKIDSVNQEYIKLFNSSEIQVLEIPKSDLTIETNGLIFLNEEGEYFATNLFKLLNSIENENDLLGIQYILTDYTEPEVTDNKIILKTFFDLSKIELDEDNNLKIKINLSGSDPKVKFKNIKVEIYRDFIPYIKNLFI